MKLMSYGITAKRGTLGPINEIYLAMNGYANLKRAFERMVTNLQNYVSEYAHQTTVSACRNSRTTMRKLQK